MTAATIALALALGGCSSSDEPEEKTGEDAAETAPEVDWSQHSTQQKKIIDKAARKGDCELLQDTFDVQANREPADPDILDYIDAKLREADCY